MCCLARPSPITGVPACGCQSRALQAALHSAAAFVRHTFNCLRMVRRNTTAGAPSHCRMILWPLGGCSLSYIYEAGRSPLCPNLATERTRTCHRHHLNLPPISDTTKGHCQWSSEPRLCCCATTALAAGVSSSTSRKSLGRFASDSCQGSGSTTHTCHTPSKIAAGG